jgi:hypothetical protein
MIFNNKYCTKKSSVGCGKGLLQSIAVTILSVVFVFSQFSDLNLSFKDESVKLDFSSLVSNENGDEDKKSQLPDSPLEDSETPEDTESLEETEHEINLCNYLNKPYTLSNERICAIDSCKENLLLSASRQSIQNRSRLSLVVILHSWKIHYS